MFLSVSCLGRNHSFSARYAYGQEALDSIVPRTALVTPASCSVRAHKYHILTILYVLVADLKYSPINHLSSVSFELANRKRAENEYILVLLKRLTEAYQMRLNYKRKN